MTSQAAPGVHTQHHDEKQGPGVEMEDDLKAAQPQGDYSGAQIKTDTREIALVRKLDLWIMPILWLMYWLNYLVSRPFP